MPQGGKSIFVYCLFTNDERKHLFQRCIWWSALNLKDSRNSQRAWSSRRDSPENKVCRPSPAFPASSTRRSSASCWPFPNTWSPKLAEESKSFARRIIKVLMLTSTSYHLKKVNKGFYIIFLMTWVAQLQRFLFDYNHSAKRILVSFVDINNNILVALTAYKSASWENVFFITNLYSHKWTWKS